MSIIMMYKKITGKIVELGDTLPQISGCIADIGKGKKWLTEKEIEIETELVNLIRTFPGEHSIYAEELHNTFVVAENVWVIDAISNTTNFLHGMPHYTIVLSHVHKDIVKFAVVYDPSSKELFTAEKGKGAFLNGKEIHVSNRSLKEEIFFMMGPYFTPPRPYREKALRVIKAMSENGNTVRVFGSLGLHYAYVACGRSDVAVSFNEDTFPEFAGKLLVEEAGGKFTDFDGNILNVNTEGVIASNKKVHEEIKNFISNA